MFFFLTSLHILSLCGNITRKCYGRHFSNLTLLKDIFFRSHIKFRGMLMENMLFWENSGNGHQITSKRINREVNIEPCNNYACNFIIILIIYLMYEYGLFEFRTGTIVHIFQLSFKEETSMKLKAIGQCVKFLQKIVYRYKIESILSIHSITNFW